jgi:hypothetical protein
MADIVSTDILLWSFGVSHVNTEPVTSSGIEFTRTVYILIARCYENEKEISINYGDI